MKPPPFSTPHAWLILLQFLSLPLLGHLLGTAGGHPALANLLTPFWVFVVFPLLDTWVGLDRRNPAPESETALAAQIRWREVSDDYRDRPSVVGLLNHLR